MDEHFHEGRCCGPRFPGMRIFGLAIAGVVFTVVFALLFGWLVEMLWNWLMPVLFHLTTITYWQAFGIVVLAKILFGGFHGPSRHRNMYRHMRHFHHHHKHWDNSDDLEDRDDTWKPHGSYKNWKYYDRYWRDEGKSAFESYIDKMEKEGKV
ncbi:MAG TPA: hypothetical protein VF335_05230 [Chitinivibrionales bacterium]